MESTAYRLSDLGASPAIVSHAMDGMRSAYGMGRRHSTDAAIGLLSGAALRTEGVHVRVDTDAHKGFATSPEWILVDDAARLACVTTRTIRRWDNAGLIRTSRPAGGRVLVNRDSLRALIENGVSS